MFAAVQAIACSGLPLQIHAPHSMRGCAMSVAHTLIATPGDLSQARTYPTQININSSKGVLGCPTERRNDFLMELIHEATAL